MGKYEAEGLSLLDNFNGDSHQLSRERSLTCNPVIASPRLPIYYILTLGLLRYTIHGKKRSTDLFDLTPHLSKMYLDSGNRPPIVSRIQTGNRVS